MRFGHLCMKRAATVGGCLLLVGLVAAVVLGWHNVPLAVTAADRVAIATLLEWQAVAPLPAAPKLAEQLRFIREVQAAVLAVAPHVEAIPYGQPREPADLLAAGGGLCYDRSRTIEKILRQHGFAVRHVALYAMARPLAWPVAMLALASRRTLASHATTEVLTVAGWLVVSSNDLWLSVDAAGQPVGLADWPGTDRHDRPGWQVEPTELLYRQPFLAVYGLYSRHGRFYPPYNAIPDLNWREFVGNLPASRRATRAAR